MYIDDLRAQELQKSFFFLWSDYKAFPCSSRLTQDPIFIFEEEYNDSLIRVKQ